MCEGDRFDKLIRRAFQTCDELAFKVLRNLSQQENIAVKRRFGPYVEQMVMLLKVCFPPLLQGMLDIQGKVKACGSMAWVYDYEIPAYLQAPEITAELFVEVLGALANLYIPEFDFLGLVRKHDLLQFLATYAQPGAGESHWGEATALILPAWAVPLSLLLPVCSAPTPPSPACICS